MLGCSGEDADAVGAYAHVALAECEGAVETWTSLPRHRWPAHWHKLGHNDPVVHLRLNLYGRPKAGVRWEHPCSEQIWHADLKELKGTSSFGA